MGKLIIAKEEIKSIRGMYGLNEQTESLSVSGNYKATNCDELHAFQGTSGKVIGNMNVIVGNKIKELNSNGINVKPIAVTVVVNGMSVNWTVLFEQSDVNWVGFTSRGAGCNNTIDTRAGNDQINNGPKSVVQALSKQGKTVGKIEIINEYKHDGGNNSFKQVFYRYTLVETPSKTTVKPTLENFKTWIKSDWIDPKTKKSQLTGNEVFTKEGDVYVVDDGVGAYLYIYNGTTFEQKK